MKIELITMWYNEELLAPFFLNHYSWVDKIHILLTPAPNDRTEAIVKRYPNVEIEYFRFPDDKIDDILKIDKFNEKYRSCTEADYVILVDSDEFIFCDQINKPVRSHLEASMKDVYFVNFWQIYKHEQDLPLDPKLPVVYQRRHGDPDMFTPFNILYVKPVVVKGRLDIAWTPGNHELIYQDKSLFWRTRNTDEFSRMNISTTKREMLQGAHWRLVDLDETIARRIGNRKNRISQNNLSKGLGVQNFNITEEDIIKEYNDHKNDPEVIRDDGIPDWQPVRGSIQETSFNTPESAAPAVNRNNPLRQSKQASYYGFARPEIIEAIRNNNLSTAKVLEIGCAGGATGKSLKESFPVQYYVGIEVSQEAANTAKKHLDRVIIADVEKTDLASEHGLMPGEFDLLLALDVLEHLYNPWDVLAELSRYLKPGGYVVASIPNIQNITIVEDLIKGNWQYQDAGILDATHMRFFTLEASKQMFNGAGLTIKNLELVFNPPIDMEKVKESGNIYHHGNLEISNLSKNELLYLFTYQYILIAQKAFSPELLNTAFIKSTTSNPDLQIAREHSGKCIEGLISIIILTFNQLEYTKECVKSIQKHTPEPHEIIFVDNGSTDKTVKWLRTLVQENKNYKLIENKRNLGFAKGCNQGIEASHGEFILLLNNDVVVSDGWLSGLLECLNHDPTVGIVGPMTNNISGPQQVFSDEYRSVSDLNTYAAKFRKQYRHRRISLRRIVGFCMLFKHALAEQIGVMDESFGTGNFEDDDFCLRAALAGYKNHIAGDVFIHHYGSKSFIGNKIDYSSSMSGNIKIFEEKWTGLELSTPLGKKVAAQNFIDKAETLYQKGGLDKAIAMLIEGIRYAPEEIFLYYNLAEMLLDNNLYKDALEAINSMPLEVKDDLKRLELIAYCTEDLNEAARYVDRIMEKDKTYPPALNLKGIIAHKQGDDSAAEGFFLQAIASDPGYGEPYTNRGMLKWALDKREEALDLLEKGFILSPTPADNVALYHSAITELEQFARAEGFVRDAKALHPENKRILFFLIDMLIKQHKYDRAMDEIERAMLDIGIDDGMLAAALEIRSKVGTNEIDKAVKNKGTLSLCMIVKDEEQHLTRCLLSAKPAVDEMIIVDTGSTDRTKEIAQAFGAKVFDFTWTNDFSIARNQSLSMASGDWVLVLDADEVISPLDYAELEKIVRKKPAKPVAYSMVTRNYTNEVAAQGWTANDRKYRREEAGTGWFPSLKVRLFVNDKRIRFQNPVHEFVEASLENAGIEIKTLGIPVHHYGRFDKDKLLAKGRKYFLLGKQKIEEMNGDIKALKELAVQASELGEYETGVQLWKKVIELNGNDSKAFLNISYAFIKLEQYREALVSSRRALELEPTMKEAALNYAGSELFVGDINKTISVLETLLQRDPNYPPAMALIAAAYYISDQKEVGLALFEKLRKRGFNCTEFLDEQYRGVISQGKLDQAVLLLEAAIKTGNISKDTHRLYTECKNKKDARHV
jgi:O-antigen biosynthesis protein